MEVAIHVFGDYKDFAVVRAALATVVEAVTDFGNYRYFTVACDIVSHRSFAPSKECNSHTEREL
jgi:hypothetical protein